MREYKTPVLERYEIDVCDVIITSPGTETTVVGDPDGVWDLSLDID